MTREEALKLVYVLQAAYPQAYRDFNAQKTENLVDVWASMLEDYPYEIAGAGLKAFMANDTKGFPPVPGQVIGFIQTATEPELTASEAWALVVRALRNGFYGAEKEFNKLPPLVQKAVGTPTNLSEMAVMDASAVNSVQQSLFVKQYNAVVQREKELAKIPQSVRALISKTQAQMIEAGDP